MPFKDPEANRIYMATYRQNHREAFKKYQTKYLEKKVSQVPGFITETRAKERARYAKDSTKQRARHSRWSMKNRAKRSADNLAWRQANPDKIQALRAARRAREYATTNETVTSAQWAEIKKACGHRCAYCHKKRQRLTMDHITPLIRGGKHTIHNIVPACSSCNSKKHTGPPLTPVQPLLLTMAQTSEKASQ